jgi:hypothetical protein
MRQLSAIGFAGVLMVLGSRQAGAQEPRLDRLDPDTRASVQQVIQSAEAKGLPVGPIVERALFAARFSKTRDVIESSAKSAAERLAISKEALAPSATPADMVEAEKALKEGVTKRALSQLRTELPGQPLVVPIAVLTQLVTNKVPVDRAADMVVQLVRAGAREAQLVAFGNEVNADITDGYDPLQALSVRSNKLSATLPIAPAAGQASNAGAQALNSDGKKKP